MFNHY